MHQPQVINMHSKRCTSLIIDFSWRSYCTREHPTQPSPDSRTRKVSSDTEETQKHRPRWRIVERCRHPSQMDFGLEHITHLSDIQRTSYYDVSTQPLTPSRIQTVQELNEPILRGILQNLPNLQGLHVVACPKIEHVTILESLVHTPSLESLSFTAWVCYSL